MYTEPPDGLECARKQFTFDLGQTTRKVFIHSFLWNPMDMGPSLFIYYYIWILFYFECRYKLGSSDVKVLSSDDEERTQELEEQAAPMEDTSERPDLQSQIHALTEEMVKVCCYD